MSPVVKAPRAGLLVAPAALAGLVVLTFAVTRGHTAEFDRLLRDAFGGLDFTRRACAHAIAQRYRFFSYGDAMLIERRD